jgi:hypothetical protein
MASKVLWGAVAAAAVAVIGGGLAVHRLENPTYTTTRTDGPTISFEYPAAWPSDRWVKANREDTAKSIMLEPETTDLKYNPPFNTRWDRAEETFIDVYTEPNSKLPPPHEWLLKIQQGIKNGRTSQLYSTKIAGHEAWVLTQPHYQEMLDIGLPPDPGFFKSIYLAFFGGQATEVFSVMLVGDRNYQIRYILPGDKIARKRYERVYSRMIDSLVIKG